MGVIKHRSGPGVQHAKQGRLCAHPLRVGAKLLNAGCGRPQQQSIHELLVRAGQGAQLRGQRKGQQVIRTGQQVWLLLLQPLFGLLALALGAVPVTARMIAVMQPTALRAAVNLSTQSRRAALQDGSDCSLLTGQNRPSGANLRSGGADNICYLQHENR